MESHRIRRADYDPAYESWAVPMYWLSKRDVPRGAVAAIFDKTVNDVSVNATKGSIAARKPPRSVVLPAPDLSLAPFEEDLLEKLSCEDLQHEVEQEAARFWTEVRGLAGTRPLHKLLRKINRPGEENIERWRLRARVEHLLAEMYLHAGYLRTSIDFSKRSLTTRLHLYDQTRFATELFSYAKTTLLLTCALEIQGEFRAILPLLEYAEQAFEAARSPVDPELHRQRASALVYMEEIGAARREYLRAYETFPAHRRFLGSGDEEYARYDVGKRPIALLDEDYDRALESLAVAQGWPEGDIHRSTNLNHAIAAAFLTDSSAEQIEMLKRLPEARSAAAGYGRQTTTVRLLELIPRIPANLHHDWVLFALRYNAYARK